MRSAFLIPPSHILFVHFSDQFEVRGQFGSQEPCGDFDDDNDVDDFDDDDVNLMAMMMMTMMRMVVMMTIMIIGMI